RCPGGSRPPRARRRSGGDRARREGRDGVGEGRRERLPRRRGDPCDDGAPPLGEGRRDRASDRDRPRGHGSHRRVRPGGHQTQGGPAHAGLRGLSCTSGDAMTGVAEATTSILREPEYRIEGRDKVTGAARFAADIVRPGMLHAAYVTSPFPLAPEAPVLHPDAAGYAYLGGGTRPTVPHPNVQGHGIREHGDVDAGFAASHRVYEHTFTVARTHQSYLEPRASLVWLEGDRIRVVTTNKAPFALRQHLSVSLGIPESRIVVDAGHIGGDFGGK